MAFEYRGSETDYKVDETVNARVYRYSTMDEIPWTTFAQQPNLPVRIIVQSRENVLPLDVVYIPRDHNRLLVGIHGAEFGNKNLPKFQFVRSFTNERPESLLFLSDSTLLHHLGEIGIAWFAGDRGINITVAYVNLIRSLIRATGIQETVLAGHSAGGMVAIKMGASIPNSRAIAVNAQAAASLYHQWSIQPLVDHVFKAEADLASMYRNYPERFDLRHTLQKRYKDTSFSWFSHVDDTSSFDECPNFEAMRDFYNLDEYGGRTPNGDVIVAGKWATPPLPHALPGTIIPFIAATLDEPTTFDLALCADADTVWRRETPTE